MTYETWQQENKQVGGFETWQTENQQPEIRYGGTIAEFGKGLVSGELGVAKGLVGTAVAAITMPEERVRKVGTAWGGWGGIPEDIRLREEKKKQERIASLRGVKTKIASAQERFAKTHAGAGAWAGRVIGEAIPYMANAMAGGYAVGPVGAAMVGFAVEGDNAYDDAIASGATEEQAQTERVIVGSINAAIEALQITRLMKFHKAGKHSIKNFIQLAKNRAYKQMAVAGKGFGADVLRISIEEGLEEFAQEGVSVGVPALLRGEYPVKEDGTADWWAIGERLGGAALGGAVAGGVLGAAGQMQMDAEAAPAVMSKKLTVIRKRLDEAFRENDVTKFSDIIEKQLVPLPPSFEKNSFQGMAQTLLMEMENRGAKIAPPAVGPIYRGEAYRSPTGFQVKGTAADVVRYEQEELGNDLGVTKEQLKRLEGRPASDIVWVTRDKVEAARYAQRDLEEEITAEDLAAVEEIDIKGGEIIADIGPEGVLVLRPTIPAEPTTSEQAIGQQYGLSNEEVNTRLSQAEGRYRELKQKETTKRTVKEAQELKFLKKKRTDVESLLEWDTTPEKEAEKRPRQKPYQSQYVAGHEIPKILDMKDAERRKFMKKETGETSMAEMTPSMAQEYINALHKLAREKGIETGILPPERVFKKPIIGLTPQLYKAKILGVEFMTKPAAIGKQEFDLEFAKEAKQVDKMERIINRLGGETVRTKTAARLKGKPTKSIVRFAELLNKHEEAPASLSKEEADVFNYYRNLNRTIITRENEVREELGMEPIEYKPGYMRHIVDVLAQDVVEGRHPIPEELKYWAEEHAAKKIRNPMEFQRKLGDELEEIFSNDLTKATKAMLWTGLREIHLDKPLKFFETQMGLHSEVIPASTKKWAEDFINHMIVGKQTAKDQRLNEMVKESGIGKVINKVLRPFGRRVSNKPLTNLLAKAGRLQIYGVMGWRPKQLIRNKFQFLQNLAFYTIKANLKSFLPASKQLKGLMDESLFLKTYKGFEDLTAIDKRTLGRLWLAPFQWTAVSNARRAMKVAYYDTMELIEDSKYKDLGWADPQRTYTEEKDFLYSSEKKKLLDEMEFGAGCTQYHYIPMAMPGAFKYKIATPLTRLQSWWMNYFFKFHREAAHRFFKGETREGLKLPWSRRAGWGRYMIIGGVVLNTLGYTSSYMFGAAPEGVPPLAQLLINMWKYTITDNERARASAKRKFLYALKTFIPGYLAAKDVSAMLDKDKGWEDLLFYKKGIFAEEKARPGIVRRRQRGRARERK